MSVEIQFSGYLIGGDYQGDTVFDPDAGTVPRSDYGRFQIFFLNEDKSEVLDTYDSDWVYNNVADTAGGGVWQHLIDNRRPPVGTRWLRVWIHTKKLVGSIQNVWFDTISIKVQSSISGLSGELMVNGGFETPESGDVLTGWSKMYRHLTVFPPTDLRAFPFRTITNFPAGATIDPQAGTYFAWPGDIGGDNEGFKYVSCKQADDIDLSDWADEIDDVDDTFVVPTSIGFQVHPHNLFFDPNAVISVNTEASGYEAETNLRDPRLTRKYRSTGTTAIISNNVTAVDARLRHADFLILLPGHNLLIDDTIQYETHNGGASVFDETFVIDDDPDSSPTLWGEISAILRPYGLHFWPFGEDALAAASQIRITATTTAPNTYVQAKFFTGLSFSFDRNFFYNWLTKINGLPIAALKQVRDVLQLNFGAATDNDWRLAEKLNRILGTSGMFCISLEPGASSAVVEKDGIRQHRLSYYGRLDSLIQTQERFISLNNLIINFQQETE